MAKETTKPEIKHQLTDKDIVPCNISGGVLNLILTLFNPQTSELPAKYCTMVATELGAELKKYFDSKEA